MFYKRKTLCDIKITLSECKSLIWSYLETGSFCLCEINRGLFRNLEFCCLFLHRLACEYSSFWDYLKLYYLCLKISAIEARPGDEQYNDYLC